MISKRLSDRRPRARILPSVSLPVGPTSRHLAQLTAPPIIGRHLHVMAAHPASTVVEAKRLARNPSAGKGDALGVGQDRPMPMTCRNRCLLSGSLASRRPAWPY